MIPYAIDPSLHSDEPVQPLLDDGFSPRHHDEAAGQPRDSSASLEEALASKSDF